MPNLCYSELCFWQGDGFSDRLKKLNDKLEVYHKDIESKCGGVLIKVLTGKRNFENPPRADISYFELEEDRFFLTIESAWFPPVKNLFDIIAEEYDLQYVYTAEEPGCDIYINTDVSGEIFPTKYVIYRGDMEEREYLETEGDVLQFYENLGFEVHSVEEILSMEKNNHFDDIQLYVYESEYE